MEMANIHLPKSCKGFRSPPKYPLLRKQHAEVGENHETDPHAAEHVPTKQVLNQWVSMDMIRPTPKWS